MGEKDYHPPIHTAEHLLNGTISKLLGCGRAFTTHVEKKKSKCDYRFERNMTAQEIEKVQEIVNKAIDEKIAVEEEYISRQEAISQYNLLRLPDDAGDQIRIVHIGSYDSCPCIGSHVQNTSQIKGRLRIVSTDHDPERNVLRVRFKLVANE